MLAVKFLIAIRITIARYFLHDEFFNLLVGNFLSHTGVGVTPYAASGAALQWF